MKKYMYGFLFFMCLTSGSLIGLFLLTLNPQNGSTKEVQATETVDQPYLAETQKEEPIHLVLNQEFVKTDVERYCLMAEEGYLIVYDYAKDVIDLVTHMPITDFPVKEQERLMEGIWFSTMSELFSYLESYSS